MTHSSDTTRIAFLHGGALGDLVLTFRLTYALRARFAPAALTLFARVELGDLARRLAAADAFCSVERAGFHSLFASDGSIDPALRERLARYDWVVSAMGGDNVDFVRRLRECARGRVVLFDPRHRETDRPNHITEQWLDDLASAGLELPRDVLPQPARDVSPGEPPVAILHPGSGGRRKCWPVEDFLGLAAELARRGWAVRFMLGPVEVEQYDADLRERLVRIAPPIVESWPAEAAKCLAGCDVYVGNDAGMTHVAAVCGTRVVALFGPTDATVWRPLGPHVTVLAGGDRFAGLTIDEVAEAVGRPKSSR